MNEYVIDKLRDWLKTKTSEELYLYQGIFAFANGKIAHYAKLDILSEISDKIQELIEDYSMEQKEV